MPRLFSLLLLGLAACLVAPALPKGSTPHAQAQGFDHAGDLLPAGATMRLGTTRLRQRGIEGVTFSPDSRYLVSYGWEDFIRFWDVENGQQARRIHNRGRTYAVAFSPDGTKLAAAESGGMSVWDLRTGKEIFEKVLAGRVFSVAFSADGSMLAAAGQEKAVRVWDTATGAELFEFQTEGGGEAQPVAFSPDGKLLASGSVNGTIRIWGLSGEEDPLVINQAHERQVVSLVFTPEGDRLYSSSFRSQRIDAETRRWVSEIFLWKIPEATKSGEFKLRDEERGAECPLALSTDGRILVSAHFEQVVLWDTQSRKPIRFFRAETNDEGLGRARTYGVAISPGNRFVAAIGFDHKVNLWEVASGNPVFPQHGTHHDAVLSVDTSPDGTLIATSCEGGEVHLWDAVIGRHVRRLLHNHGWIRSVAFTPDSDAVIAAGEIRGANGYKGFTKIIRVIDGTVERLWSLPDPAMCTAVSADGKRLAAAVLPRGGPLHDEPPSTIHVFDLVADRELQVLKGHMGQVQQLQFDKDGTTLWSSSEDSTIRNWNVESGEELDKFSVEEGDGRVLSIAIARDAGRAAFGRYISSQPPEPPVGHLATIGLEDENDWQRAFPTHFPSGAVFSPDNRLLAVSLRATSAGSAAGENHRIVLLLAISGREVLSFELEDGMVRSLAFSRDGRTLYSGMDRGDVLVWDIARAYD